MKKFLRFLLILILLAVVVVVVAGLMAPKETNITSTTMIDAPKAAVWEQMVKFKNWPNWSPWHKLEPTQELSYAGTDGEPGSSYSWIGKKETGEGTMTNTGVENGKMTYELKFVKPFEATSSGYLMVEDGENGMTKATWTFHGENDKFFMRAMGYLMGMTKMLQGQFDEGLANMKAYVEEHKGEMAANTALTVEEVQFAGATYAGYKSHVTMDNYEKTFGESMGKLGTAAGARISGAPVSVIYNWDDKKMEGDVLIGAPITGDKPVDGAVMEKVAASRAYKAVYVGDPAGTGKAHEAIGAKLAEKGEKPVLMIEEYTVAGDKEKDKNKWVTTVYYTLK